MKRFVRRLVRTFGLALLTLLLAVTVSIALLAWQVDRLGRSDEARPADVIVVLGARVEPDGRPGSDLTSRTYHAVDLWQAGYAAHIICAGGFKDEPLSAAAVCRRFAVDLGAPPAHVLLADGSSDTAGDAEATARVMAARGWRTAILVSHPLHLFRARWLFGRAGVTAVTSPTSTETGRIFLPLRIWYLAREAAAMLMTVLGDLGWWPAEWRDGLRSWSYGLP